MVRFQQDVLQRWPRNPIITLEDIPYRCNTVFNGAVTKFKNEYIMMLRVENLEGHSVVLLARSNDGYHFAIDDKPCMEPCAVEPFKTYETKGVEDPRIICVEGTFYVMYTAYSTYGARIGLAKTDDFKTFERIALISEPGNKDGLLFPRKINGKYVRLDRPIGGDIGNIWISFSHDLIHWGESRVLVQVRDGQWDQYRIGGSVPPIETKAGWLEIYHGVKMTSCGPIYRLGVFLMDLNDPTKVVGRSDIPILSPREPYERIGDINNVVFSCGAVVEDNGEVKVYYGAADTCICLAVATLDELIASCTQEYR
ncbi:MAG: glycoside hydrolase family 130 protein [Candidatus Omnitrophica bacterium]|nr:glycoside hydrolase family 130 protein [Candidatus Omnitrophota bacterium]